jgi:hypothetical protein
MINKIINLFLIMSFSNQLLNNTNLQSLPGFSSLNPCLPAGRPQGGLINLSILKKAPLGG